MRTTLRVFAGCSVPALLLCGCSTVPMGSAQPSFELVRSVSASGIPATSVGTFSRGPELSAQNDQQLGIRAVTLIPPQGDSFSQYLGELLKADLTASGKLDPNAPTIISGQLDRNEVNGGSIDTNSAVIVATFIVTRGSDTIFRKQYEASSQWESAFMGVEAIPATINQYTALYNNLLQQLFADTDFRSAIQGGARL